MLTRGIEKMTLWAYFSAIKWFTIASITVNNMFHKAFELNGVRADGINITLITLLGRDLIWLIHKVGGYHLYPLQLNYD